MPADCEIDGCGVLAVGRCHECGRAFCASHQAYGSHDRVRFTDRCSACLGDEERRGAQDKQDRREGFLRLVRSCEARPFPQLLAGAALHTKVQPPQQIPWCLYDSKLKTASLHDDDLCSRIAHDFVDEALCRRIQPEERVRTRRSTKKGFLQRVHWEDVYVQGWVIPEGSNRWGGGTSEKRLPAIIWIDGEIGAEHPGDRSWGGLHDGALATMAEILGVNTTPQAGHRQGPA